MTLQVHGVFEGEPVLQRAVRQAAKFASPDEEAAARRLELTGICKDTIGAPTDAFSEQGSSSGAQAQSPVRGAKGTSWVTTEEPIIDVSPLRSARGPNIAERTAVSNTALIDCLNKVYGGAGTGAASPVRAFTPPKSALLQSREGEVGKSPVPSSAHRATVDKSVLLSKTKSKLLKVPVQAVVMLVPLNTYLNFTVLFV